MSHHCILTIDQGTTGTKVHAFNKNGEIVASSYREFTQIFPHPAWVEHDASEIWNGVHKLLLLTLSKLQALGYKKKDILALGITNQRETVLAWDRHTGEPLCNAIVWQCRRTTSRCLDILKTDAAEKIHRKTGLIVDAYFSATKLEWILDNIPNLRQRIKNKNDVIVGTIDSWLLYKLNGNHATDYSNASRTMLFNIIKKQWDAELLDIFNIPANILPSAVPSSHNYGTIESIQELSGIPITALIGDQQAALFGQLCTQKGQMKNTYGTGCFLLLNTGDDCIFSHSKLLTTLCCDDFGMPAYALEGSVFIGGAVIQWLRDKLNFFDNTADINAITTQFKDELDEVVFVPAFNGLASPYWDMNARGTILGISRDTSKEQIIKAALKSIAFQSYDLIQAMQKDIAHNDLAVKIDTLHADGGACENPYLMQFQADILNCNITHPKNLDTTATGAAYLAGLTIKLWSPEDLKNLSSISSSTHYTSQMQEIRRKQEIDLWARAVERSRDWHQGS